MYRFIAIFSLILSGFTFAQAKSDTSPLAEAYFAGGCFWCMEPPFEKLDGVKEVVSGYAGGTIKNPSYKQVAGGQTKHREAVKIVYDPKRVKYEKLLEVFWRNINPTDDGGQFVDRGFQYSSAVFYANEDQKRLAESSVVSLEKSKIFKKKIVTPVLKYSTFYKAEDYHQDYYKKNPIRYKFYRYNSGRDNFIEKTWDKKDKK